MWPRKNKTKDPCVGNVLYLDSVNVNILVVRLCYDFAGF